MAENKKSFVLYADYKEVFEQLSDKDAGKLIKHLFKYVNDENPAENDPIVRLAFTPIKMQLKRDLKKWADIKVKRSDAGKVSAERRQQKATNSTHVDFVQQTSTNPTVTVNVTDNVTVTDTVIDNTVPNHQHQSHETFAEKLFTQNGELDKQKLELQLNPRRLLTKKDCEEFNLHLFTEKKHHVHWSAYTSHLRNWLNTRPDNTKKQNYGKENQTNPRLGRIDTETVHSVLNRRKDKSITPEDCGSEEAEYTEVDG